MDPFPMLVAALLATQAESDAARAAAAAEKAAQAAAIAAAPRGRGRGPRDRGANEQRHQYYPERLQIEDETLYAPRAGLALKYGLSKDVVFTEDAEILPNVVGDSRVVMNSVSKISTRLSRSLAFGVAFTVSHDSRPAPGKVTTDTALALTLDVLL